MADAAQPSDAAPQPSDGAVEAGWDAPPQAASVPVLHLEGFDGPMDLLLDLAERQRIDLERLSVRVLAEQFVAALEPLAGTVPIERRADWLVLATRLVLLRSRLLFPASPEEAATAERDAAAELRRLDEMAFIRTAASWLRARPQLGIDVFARPQPEVPRREGGYARSWKPAWWSCRTGQGARGRLLRSTDP